VFSVLLWFLVLMFTLDFSLVLSFIHSVTAWNRLPAVGKWDS
jgi:hypothetical protein